MGVAALLLWCSANAFAQAPEQEMARLEKSYARMKRFSVEVSFKLYPDLESTRAAESGTAQVRRRDDLYWTRLFHLETLVGRRHIVIADHSSQTLMIDRRPAESSQPAPYFSVDLESILGEPVTPESLDELPALEMKVEPAPNGQRVLTLDYPEGEHRRIRLWYDPATYRINRVALEFRESVPVIANHPAPPRIEIEYTNFNANPKFSKLDFSEERYFTLDRQGHVVPAQKYRDYRLINHLEPLEAPEEVRE